MSVPSELLYSQDHEWVRVLADGTAEVGITDHAQDELSDIVFVNLPEVGDACTAGEAIADVESVKAVSDIISPINGTVAAINESLDDTPGAINSNPYETWLIKVSDVSGLDELMSASAYEAFLKEE